MAKFLKGNELNAGLEKIFESAGSDIILISPYIKLHDRFKSALLTKQKEDTVKITVVFGKNEEDMSRSMKQEDFDFFKQFPNIEIRFEKRLHAKYYANESKSILTSMNLYGFSQNNNIETGVLIEKTIKGKFTGENDLDIKSWEYFITVIEQAELLFERRPDYEKKSLLGGKKYVGSEIIIDKLSDFFSDKKSKNKSLNNFSKKSKIEVRPERETKEKIDNGFCIRSGKKIEFNTKQPMSRDSWKTWNEYKNKDFPEKYCHFSGEPSNGETTISKPILSKNWKKAKEEFSF